MRRHFSDDRSAFTLVEMLVSIAVLTLLVLIMTWMLNGAAAITTLGHKHMDADNQARPALDRIAEDLGRIVKRGDVSYYLKANAADGGPEQLGNDQIAFFSEVPGYYPATGSQSPFSLVSYRLNSTTNHLERLSHGLLWNGASTADPPMVFLPLTIAATWPAATNQSQDPNDPVVKNYELIGQQIFRFEYYYQLYKLQTSNKTNLSDTPWDNEQGHSSVDGLRDVGAIVVVIATIDPKTRLLVSDAQLTSLAGQMVDYTVYPSNGNSGKVGPALTELWQEAVNNNSLNLPPAVLAGIHYYQRYFYLNGAQE